MLQKQQTQVKSISNVSVNAQNVRHLRLHKLADSSRNSRLQIASCGNSSQIFTSADFSSGMSFGCGFIYKTEWPRDVVVKLVLGCF